MLNLNWFKRKGLFFIPTTWIGWLIFTISLVYLVYVFIQIDGISHSISDTMINFVFIVLIISAVYSLIAYLTSSKNKASL